MARSIELPFGTLLGPSFLPGVAVALVASIVIATFVFRRPLREAFSGYVGLLLFPALAFVILFGLLVLTTSLLPKSHFNEAWSVLGKAGSILSGVGTFFVAMALGASFLTLLIQKRMRDEEAIDTRWYKLLERLPVLRLEKHYLAPHIATHAANLTAWFNQAVALMTAYLSGSSTGAISKDSIAQQAINQSVNSFSPGLVETFSALYALRSKADDSQKAFLDDSLASFISQESIFCGIFESIAKRKEGALRLLFESNVASLHLGSKSPGVILLKRVIDVYDDA
jgi:hypothetical protein